MQCRNCGHALSGYGLEEPGRMLAEGTSMARRSASTETLMLMLANLGAAYWHLGRFADIADVVDEELAAAARAGIPGLSSSAYRLRADALFALDRESEAGPSWLAPSRRGPAIHSTLNGCRSPRLDWTWNAILKRRWPD